MHVPRSPIVHACRGGVVGGGEVVGGGAGGGAGAGAGALTDTCACSGAGPDAVDADDAGVPLDPPPPLPTGACDGAPPPAGEATGVAARLGGVSVTEATGTTFPRGPTDGARVTPPACTRSGA
jgi:hypothetical protein